MSKILYNLQGIIRMLTPRIFTQRALDSVITSIFRLDTRTLEAIALRVNHYHKHNTPFTISPLPHHDIHKSRLSLASPHFDTLQNNTLTTKHSSVYYYDSYEWSRYFPNHFAWYYEFGDVNYYLTHPSITKTRPISTRHDANASLNNIASHPISITSNALDPAAYHNAQDLSRNSILLQLEKHRHFSFIHDDIPYEKKRNILFFRGACPQAHRQAFLQKYFFHPLCDIGHTGAPNELPLYAMPKISKHQHLHYKFLLSLEGNDVASNLKWVLGSNALCIMPKPRYESWFMEEMLQEGIHYARISDDYSDVEDVLEFYLTNEQEAKEIIHNANVYCKQFYNHHIEAACNILVLRKYFFLSNQSNITRHEQELLGL